MGQVEWTVVDLRGTVKTIRVTAYYVPDAPIRILSPRQWFRCHGGGSLSMDAAELKLVCPDETELVFPFQGNNLPLMMPTEHKESTNIMTARECRRFPFEAPVYRDDPTYLNCASDKNKNLSQSQRKLLLWHAKCGHVNMQWLRNISRWRTNEGVVEQGPLPAKHKEFTNGKCANLKCAVCQMAKQHRRSPVGEDHARRQQNGNLRREARPTQREMLLCQGNLKPGDRVSIDH